MAPIKHKARRKPSITKAAAVDNDRHRHHRQQQWPWSELPPFLQINNLRSHNLNQQRDAPPGIIKSWLPSTTRCAAAAHQLRQLYHADSSPNPNLNPHHNHFLGDSSIAEAVYGMPDASHWCFLKSDQTARIHPPPESPFKLHNSLGPRPLRMNGVLSPNAPTSGLMVGYTVYRNTGATCFGISPFRSGMNARRLIRSTPRKK